MWEREIPQYVGKNRISLMENINFLKRSTLHLNEPTWIIDGFNELIVYFLFALVIFLDSTQPQPLKSSNEIIFLDQTNECHVNTIAMLNNIQTSHQLPPVGSFKCRTGVPLTCALPQHSSLLHGWWGTFYYK